MNKIIFTLILVISIISACAPSPQAIQTAIAETQAVWTKIPPSIPQSTFTPQPTYTVQPAIVVTRVVVQTPTPLNQELL